MPQSIDSQHIQDNAHVTLKDSNGKIKEERTIMRRPKVLLCILNQGQNSAGLETQLIRWMSELRDKYEFDFFPAKYTGRPISSNRNEIVRDFLKIDYDYLVMIDDDNPPNSNFLLLLDLDKDVLSIPTPGRDWRGIHWHVYDFDEKSTDEQLIFKDIPVNRRTGLQQVGAVGTGCIMIARRVLEKIKRPFEDLFDEDGVIKTNDDLAFSSKCRREGFTVWAHFDYTCSHYKNVDLLQMLRLIQMAGAVKAPHMISVDLKDPAQLEKVKKLLQKN